jgi:carboxyl-terminal processing protease
MDNNNIKQVVLDLRNNTGGEVSRRLMLPQQFVPKGTITTLNFKSPDIKDIVYESSLEATKYKWWRWSRAHSQCFGNSGGSHPRYQAGVLVGTKTFGKARVQGGYTFAYPGRFTKYSRPEAGY